MSRLIEHIKKIHTYYTMSIDGVRYEIEEIDDGCRLKYNIVTPVDPKIYKKIVDEINKDK